LRHQTGLITFHDNLLQTDITFLVTLLAWTFLYTDVDISCFKW